jgi:hypothetical protein
MPVSPLLGATVVLVVGLVVPFAILAIRSYIYWREPRLVRCPQTGTLAHVDVDARAAAAVSPLGTPDLHLRDCSLWPRSTCVQECLKDVAGAPDECRVRWIVARWYEGKRCVFCKKAIPPLHLVEHHPALMTEDGDTIEWTAVTPESLPDALATHLPVCWNCHVAESFRREHPDLVVDRDNLGSASRLVH